MPELEERLRRTLRDVADGVTPSATLDDAVREHFVGRPRRRGRRSAWRVAVAGAVAVVAIGVTMVAIRQTRTGPATHPGIGTGLCRNLNAITTRLNQFAELEPRTKKKEAASLSATLRKTTKTAPRSLKADLVALAKAFAIYPRDSGSSLAVTATSSRNVIGYDAQHCHNPNNRPDFGHPPFS
jgi:hypothetical protein